MLIPGIDMIRLFFERISKRNPFSNDRWHFHHLLLNKYGYVKTIIIINLFILFPILSYHFDIAKLDIIIMTIKYLFFFNMEN